MARKQNIYTTQDDCIVGYTNKNEPFLVDIEDYDKVKNFCWYKNNKGYLASHYSGGKPVLLHRLIMDASVNELVDHISHDTADNRKSNLRLCSRSQNGMNRMAKGYTWDKRDNKWRARITVGGRNFDLGYFPTEADAKSARDAAAQKYFGEFAYKEQNEKPA